MPKGQVKHSRWSDKGYCFLTSDAGSGDVFLHVTNAPRVRIEVGDWYEYQTRVNDKGKLEAFDVKPIKDRATIDRELSWLNPEQPPVKFGE
jgi:cold shock CspA family protein